MLLLFALSYDEPIVYRILNNQIYFNKLATQHMLRVYILTLQLFLFYYAS